MTDLRGKYNVVEQMAINNRVEEAIAAFQVAHSTYDADLLAAASGNYYHGYHVAMNRAIDAIDDCGWECIWSVEKQQYTFTQWRV